MAESIAAGLHASTWKADATSAPAPAEVARAARYYMVAQVENGHMCPITMTRACGRRARGRAGAARKLMPKILSRHYDPLLQPWREKIGITLGMGMTEKQGGTDVRANTTSAEPAGDGYRITGHKWFMSAPMCDAFLVLAQAPGGLTCFLMPRFRPDGGSQRAALPAAQGQARQPLERLVRGRVRRRLRLARRRGGRAACAPSSRWCS